MTSDRLREVSVHVFGEGALRPREDRVATEEPLEIRIQGEPLAVIMRTPGDDIELTAGFLYAEGIIRDSDDIGTIRHCTEGLEPDDQNVIEVSLEPGRAAAATALLAQRRAERATVTSTSCGVCGKRSIEALHRDAPPFEGPVTLPLDQLGGYPSQLRAAQAVFAATGGLHAAGVFGEDGELFVVKEDVGRHNAVDKVIGALLLREALPIERATLMVSGRTSFEIIQKALMGRIQTVCAVSAPSSLAIELATSSNMGLIGFVRGDTYNVYAGYSGEPPPSRPASA